MSTYYGRRERINWWDLLDRYGDTLLRYLDLSTRDIEDQIDRTRKNPVIDILQNDPVHFVHAAKKAGVDTANMDGVSRLVVIVQMVLYDLVGGPEQDYKEKSLRRHWYAYFKQFAQMFAFALGKTSKNAQGIDEMNDVQWSGRLSKVYAGFVDSGKVTYKNLWVEDASRMMKVFGTSNKLFPDFQLILAVEKDSLHSDFVSAAEAAGALAVVSGKGKMSKAATELALRNLGWSSQDSNGLEDSPMLFLHISDHDFDGEGVIGPTFGEQARRYLPYNVVEGRVGVRPLQVKEVLGEDAVWNASYQVKVSNDGYRKWADNKALFWATCTDCHHEMYVVGGVEKSYPTDKLYDVNKTTCAVCGGDLVVDQDSYDQPHGFEVESLRSADYYYAIVDGILEHHTWDDIIYNLRRLAAPTTWSVSYSIRDAWLDKIERYNKIVKAIDLLEGAKSKLTEQLDSIAQEYAGDAIENNVDEWFWLQDDPTPEDFKEHIARAARSGWGRVWRPFTQDVRTAKIVEILAENEELEGKLKELTIDDYDSLVAEVEEILYE